MSNQKNDSGLDAAQLDQVSDNAVAEALADPDPANPIAPYIAAALERYLLAFQNQSKQMQGWPTPLKISEPKNAVERAALQLFISQLQAGTGAKIDIRFD
jgi:hypothetical protein